MPYRRLPNTDKSRLSALKTLLDNNEQPAKKEHVKALFKIISNDSLTEEQKRDSIISLGIDIAEAKGVLEGISLDDTIAGNNANADKDYGNFESGYYNDGDESFDIVGLAAVTIPFITAIVIVLIVLYFNYKKRVARYNLLRYLHKQMLSHSIN